MSELCEKLDSNPWSIHQCVILHLQTDSKLLAQLLKPVEDSFKIVVIDGFSDPEGWLNEEHDSEERSSHNSEERSFNDHVNALEERCRSWLSPQDRITLNSLEDITNCLLSKLESSSVVLMDHMPTLLYRHDYKAVECP